MDTGGQNQALVLILGMLFGGIIATAIILGLQRSRRRGNGRGNPVGVEGIQGHGSHHHHHHHGHHPHGHDTGGHHGDSGHSGGFDGGGHGGHH